MSSLSGNGFHLTSAAGGVLFDISGTGHPVQMGWTAAASDNAFLALPGADGLVHNGGQLFGNFTPQPPSANPNGFAALAVYDDPKTEGTAMAKLTQEMPSTLPYACGSTRTMTAFATQRNCTPSPLLV